RPSVRYDVGAHLYSFFGPPCCDRRRACVARPAFNGIIDSVFVLFNPPTRLHVKVLCTEQLPKELAYLRRMTRLLQPFFNQSRYGCLATGDRLCLRGTRRQVAHCKRSKAQPRRRLGIELLGSCLAG